MLHVTLFLLVAPFLLVPQASAAKIENRCGWVDNSTPGNLELEDKDAVWMIAQQGIYEAKGDYNFEGEMDTTNGPHGRYCACIKMEADDELKVLLIHSVKMQKLKVCEDDKTLNDRGDGENGPTKAFRGYWRSTNNECQKGSRYSIGRDTFDAARRGAVFFNLRSENPIWLELGAPLKSSEKYVKLTKVDAKTIELQYSSSMKDRPDGTKCVLTKD